MKGNNIEIIAIISNRNSINLPRRIVNLQLIKETLHINEDEQFNCILSHRLLTIIHIIANPDEYCHSGFVSLRANTGISNYAVHYDYTENIKSQRLRFLHPLEDSFRRNDKKER